MGDSASLTEVPEKTVSARNEKGKCREWASKGVWTPHWVPMWELSPPPSVRGFCPRINMPLGIPQLMKAWQWVFFYSFPCSLQWRSLLPSLPPLLSFHLSSPLSPTFKALWKKKNKNHPKKRILIFFWFSFRPASILLPFLSLPGHSLSFLRTQ